jgi:hypothetical protein
MVTVLVWLVLSGSAQLAMPWWRRPDAKLVESGTGRLADAP